MKKTIRKTALRKISDKQKAKLEEKRENTVRQFNFFLGIWNKRPHESELTGKWLGKEPLSTFFHHILSKERYPIARYDEQNVILLSFEEHEKVENDPNFYEEINKRRVKLMEKYAKRI